MADASAEPQYMLTTIDNPYSPFTQYDDWQALDETLGYYTPGLLARYVATSDELSDVDQQQAIDDGISQLLELNPYGVHRKVTADAFGNS